MWWLLSIVLNPFATKLLIVSDQSLTVHAVRFGFYALLQILESAMLSAMLRHLMASRLADPVLAGLLRHRHRRNHRSPETS